MRTTITYRTRELEELASSKKARQKELGNIRARNFEKRISELKAPADSWRDRRAGHLFYKFSTTAYGMAAFQNRCGGVFMRSILLTVLVCASLFATAVQAQPILRTTGALAEGSHFLSYPTAMSPDGYFLVGYSRNAGGGNEAFRWTLTDGIEGLGDFEGGAFNSRAEGVSSNGIIVGYGNLNGSATGFRLIKGGEMEPLPKLSGSSYVSQPWEISADGNTIVGESKTMIRWTGLSMTLENLFDPAGGMEGASGRAISGDGSVIVGYGYGPNGTEAFRWTQEDGFQMLGDLQGGTFRSEAYGVSDDGKTVVGYSESSRGSEAFRWTEETGMVNLGKLVTGGTYTSKAVGASEDGSLIVGLNDIGGKQKVVVWDEEGEVYDIAALLGTIFQLVQPVGISKDGDIIAGWGWNTSGKAEGYIIYGVRELVEREREARKPPEPYPGLKLTLSESSASGTWLLAISQLLPTIENQIATLQSSSDLKTWSDLQAIDLKTEASEPSQSISFPPLPSHTYLRIKIAPSP